MSTSTASFCYDSLGRVVEESETYGGNTRNVTHSKWVSKPSTELTYPSGRQVTVGYDALYRKNGVNETSGGASIAAWQYFGRDRVAEVTLGNGLISTQMNNTRTRSMVQAGQSTPSWGDASSDRLGYDGAGRMTTKRYLSGGINGTTHAYNSSTSLVGFTTGFDRSGNKLYERDLHAQSRSHLYPNYDSPNRLRAYQRGTLGTDGASITDPISLPNTNTEQSYDLDGLGNWMRTTYTPVGASPTVEKRQHNYLNELMKFASTFLSYDHGNNAASGDPNVQQRGNGNITDDGSRVYAYDALNRLVQVKRKSDSATIAVYTYDAMGRRIRKVVSNGGIPNNSALNGTTDYLYDQEQCVEERNGSNSTIRQFIWGLYIDELMQMKTYVTLGAQSLAAGVYYPLSDLLYRTTALTNSSGGIVEAYDTDAYGNTLIFSAAGTGSNWWADNATASTQPANEYIFTGRQFDPETRIYFYRARYYHPQLGRFLGRDPILYVDGMNLFQYVGSNPILKTDPSGKLDPATCLGASVLGGVVGCGISAFITYWNNGSNCEIARACVCNGLAGVLGAGIGCLLVDVMPIIGGCIGGAIAAAVSILCTKLWHCEECSSPCPPAGMVASTLASTLLGCAAGAGAVSEEVKDQIVLLLASFNIAAIFGIGGC